MEYIIPTFSMLAIDSMYLTNIGGPMFDKLVRKIQGENMKINMYGVLGSYILLTLVLYKYIIAERKPLLDAFVLGICVYGVFDFTNYAIFKNYDLFSGLLDTIWGGILFYMVTWITYTLLRIRY
jgi:uncharacterized membrane protein